MWSCLLPSLIPKIVHEDDKPVAMTFADLQLAQQPRVMLSVTPWAKFLQRLPLTTYCIQYVNTMNTPMTVRLISFVRTFSVCKFTSNTF